MAEEQVKKVEPETPSQPPPPAAAPAPETTAAPKDVAEEKSVIPAPEDKPEDSKALVVVESMY